MKLSNKTLDNLSSQGIVTPKFSRADVTPGVVHIGPSNFARAHIFKYFDQILQNDLSWGIRAIDIRSPERRDAIQDQDYLYTLTEQGSDDIQRSIIGSLIDITVASETPQDALNVLCDPAIRLVTITVTQGGYGHDPATGLLDFNREDIKQCLSHMDEPSTTVGYLVSALERRMAEGAPPLTIMSCDNMPANGTILRNVVLAYAAGKSSNLRQYIETNITFPSTMVDRIVPKTTQTDVFNIAAQGIEDNWPILTENFMQWVIEDNFAGEVPDFAAVGATVIQDVEPSELMKLRMLNGAHMALGCVAGLAGHKVVDKAMLIPELRGFIGNFITEASNTVPNIEGVDFDTYRSQIISRLDNPHMSDELVRLARNGTQKIDGRVLDTLIDAKAQNTSHEYLSFTAAAWIQYLKGVDEQGDTIEINDDTAVKSGLQEIAKNSNASPIPVMEASGLFSRGLMRDQDFINSVSMHLKNIQGCGVVAAISKINTPQILNVPSHQAN